MYTYSQVVNENGESLKLSAKVYFVSVMVIGNIVMMALFTAILL